MTGATGNIYCGLHEFEDMGFVLHVLRPGDLFVDVGANVGSYTVLAAGACRARVLAIEPHPIACEALVNNVRLNGLESRVTIKSVALGARSGTVKFSYDLGTVNHVLDGTEEQGVRALDLPLATLDDVIGNESPFVLKVDVEGYETEVISGAAEALRSDALAGILIELNGSGRRYGFVESDLHDLIVGEGFTPCRYNPIDRSIQPLSAADEKSISGNMLYLRNIPAAQERVRTASRYWVLGRYL